MRDRYKGARCSFTGRPGLHGHGECRRREPFEKMGQALGLFRQPIDVSKLV